MISWAHVYRQSVVIGYRDSFHFFWTVLCVADNNTLPVDMYIMISWAHGCHASISKRPFAPIHFDTCMESPTKIQHFLKYVVGYQPFLVEIVDVKQYCTSICEIKLIF